MIRIRLSRRPKATNVTQRTDDADNWSIAGEHVSDGQNALYLRLQLSEEVLELNEIVPGDFFQQTYEKFESFRGTGINDSDSISECENRR